MATRTFFHLVVAETFLYKELVAGRKGLIYLRIYLRAISDHVAKNSMTFFVRDVSLLDQHTLTVAIVRGRQTEDKNNNTVSWH